MTCTTHFACDCIQAIIDKLPTYEDTKARFVPERGECWVVIRFPRFPDDVSFSRSNPSFDGKSWVVPVYDGESWDGKFYSSEAAAIAALLAGEGE